MRNPNEITSGLKMTGNDFLQNMSDLKKGQNRFKRFDKLGRMVNLGNKNVNA